MTETLLKTPHRTIHRTMPYYFAYGPNMLKGDSFSSGGFQDEGAALPTSADSPPSTPQTKKKKPK